MKLQKETKGHGKWYGDACGTAFALEVLGERWSVLITRELMLGGRRFSDLRAVLPGISAKVLTERLEGLESVGIIRRRQLPPPASTRVYELTSWGYMAEEPILALGRWAVRSPLHDPTLHMTPVAFMLSMRAMLDAGRADDLTLSARFDIGAEAFFGELCEGKLLVGRFAGDERPFDLVFRAGSASAFLPVFYGKRPIADAAPDLQVLGDRELAERFIGFFSLPAKVGE